MPRIGSAQSLSFRCAVRDPDRPPREEEDDILSENDDFVSISIESSFETLRVGPALAAAADDGGGIEAEATTETEVDDGEGGGSSGPNCTSPSASAAPPASIPVADTAAAFELSVVAFFQTTNEPSTEAESRQAAEG